MAEKNPALLESGLARDGSPGAFTVRRQKPETGVFGDKVLEKQRLLIQRNRILAIFIFL